MSKCPDVWRRLLKLFFIRGQNNIPGKRLVRRKNIYYEDGEKFTRLEERDNFAQNIVDHNET